MRALVVTGNPRLSAKLAEVLKSLASEVDERGDGEAALLSFEQADYGLIVTDLALSRLAGPELIRRIRSLDKGKNVPIMFMSPPLKDKGLPQRLARSYSLGPYLEMPFPFPRFVELAKKAIESSPAAGSAPVAPAAMPVPAAATETPAVGPRKLAWGGSTPGALPNFEDVMLAVRSEGFSGKARITGAGKIVPLNFHIGLPLAEFTGAGHPILEDLNKSGIITPEEFERLRKISPPSEVERYLIGAGVISPGDLAKRRAELLGKRLGEALRWPEGILTLETQGAEPGPTERLYGELALAHAVAHDVRASTNPLKLATLQNQMKNAWLAPTKDLPFFARLLPLDNDEEKIVDQVQQPAAVAAIIGGVRNPDTAWNVIRILLALRLVSKHPQMPHGHMVEFPLSLRSMHAAVARSKTQNAGEDSLELIDLSGDLADDLDAVVTGIRGKAAPVQPQPASAASDPQRTLENELFDELERAKRVNYYELLGTQKNGFKFQDAKKRYFELQRKFSPDKFIMSSGDVMGRAQELLEKLSAAFETLSDIKKKEAYDQKLSTQKLMSGEGSAGGKTLQADVAFQSGLALMETDEWDSAVQQFEIARRLQPGVAAHEVSHAWALYKNPRNRGNSAVLATVKKMLNAAVVRDPRCASGFAYRAWLLVDEGKLDLALMEFNKALRIDASLRIAQQGVQKVETLKKTQKKGLFG